MARVHGVHFRTDPGGWRVGRETPGASRMSHRCPRCRMGFRNKKPEGAGQAEICRCPECNRVFSHARKYCRIAVWVATEGQPHP